MINEIILCKEDTERLFKQYVKSQLGCISRGYPTFPTLERDGQKHHIVWVTTAHIKSYTFDDVDLTKWNWWQSFLMKTNDEIIVNILAMERFAGLELR